MDKLYNYLIYEQIINVVTTVLERNKLCERGMN
jgi:hypothetical protein